ncbi:hypothetical protein MKY91_09365 [Alkalicoccobacillus gibsonii]|uniref:Uncharacterized protein n=1 Tax=Alkalicoccobacillus gibsonii TaxID=79881 RepID=A0ABU9VHG3_9BACI
MDFIILSATLLIISMLILFINSRKLKVAEQKNVSLIKEAQEKRENQLKVLEEILDKQNKMSIELDEIKKMNKGQ